MLGNPGVGSAYLMEFFNNVAHKVYVMGTSGPIVTDRAGHAVGQRLVDHRDGKKPLFPLVNVRIVFHDLIAVKAVYDNVLVIFLGVVTDNGHGVTVLFYTLIEKFHFRGSNLVGIVGVGHDLFKWDRDNVVRRAFKCFRTHG